MSQGSQSEQSELTMSTIGVRKIGVVKLWNPARAFGCDRRTERLSQFPTRSSVRRIRDSEDGQQVSFVVGEGRKGPAACDVRVVDTIAKAAIDLAAVVASIDKAAI